MLQFSFINLTFFGILKLIRKNLFVKVVVLYDLDPAWDRQEIIDTRKSNKVLFEALREEGIETYPEELNNPDLWSILKKYDPDDTLIFNLCETMPGIRCGERSIVEFIENKGFTYTGNKAQVIGLSYDKQQVKRILGSLDINVPYGAVLAPEEASGWRLFPAIVKPALDHCSLTITEESVVFDPASLKKQILLVNNEMKQPALVEDFIDGREFHVSVWNNDPPEMLPPAEMDFSAFPELKERLCTYDSKYLPGSEHYEKIRTLVPAPLDQKQFKKLEKTVIKAWQGFGCRDYTRFDVRLRNKDFYLLDINPNNDISIDTSFALAAEIAGFSYKQLVKRIVMMAVKRHPALKVQFAEVL